MAHGNHATIVMPYPSSGEIPANTSSKEVTINTLSSRPVHLRCHLSQLGGIPLPPVLPRAAHIHAREGVIQPVRRLILCALPPVHTRCISQRGEFVIPSTLQARYRHAKHGFAQDRAARVLHHTGLPRQNRSLILT